MKLLFLCSALAPAAVGATGCGAGSTSTSTPRPPHGVAATITAAKSASSADSIAGVSADADGDSDIPGSRHDPDNDEVLSFGQTADATDRRALTNLVTRYYRLAAANDGAGACSLLFHATAESIVEEHEEASGSPSSRADTCPQIASKLFAQRHRELSRQAARLEVTEIQVRGNRGLARLFFGATPERLVAVRRERGIWKIDVLLDEEGV